MSFENKLSSQGSAAQGEAELSGSGSYVPTADAETEITDGKPESNGHAEGREIDDAAVRLKSADPDSHEAMAALGELYDLHYDFAFECVRRVVGSRLDPEDVAQDLFMKLPAKVGNYVPEAGKPFKNWLSVVVRNMAIDALRSRERYLVVEEVREEGWTTAAVDYRASVDPETHTFRREALDRILSPEGGIESSENQHVLMLRLAGYSPSEISKLTGYTESAVNGRLHRTRAKAAQILRDNNEMPSTRRAA